jgi:ubiquinone/menaquinone biosynthesis C-methylase UbiE
MSDPSQSPKAVVMENRRAYGRIASEWEKVREERCDLALHDRCRMLFLGCLKGMKILEVGCGLGDDSAAFRKAGLQVTATDIAEEFLMIIKSKGPSVDAVVMDMTAPCFSPDSFDGIYAFASFVHIPHALAPETLAGFTRMLRVGGVLMIHHAASTTGVREYEVPDLLLPNNQAFCFCHAESEFAALIMSAGLRIRSVCRLQSEKIPSSVAVRNGLFTYQMLAEKIS